MKQIRNNIFETNSSSTHSVSLHNSSKPENLIYDLEAYVDPADHYIHVPFGEFGWGYDEYEDSYNKLQYLLTMIAETHRHYYNPEYTNNDEFYNLDDFILLESIVCENTPGCKGICLASEITCEVHDDITNEQGDKYNWISFSNGYIDHQSCEDYSCLADFLEDNGLTIERFLFDENVQLIIDNDNN